MAPCCRYPDLCAEVLSANVAPVVQDAVAEEKNQSRLWAFFEKDDNLHPLLASFVCKVLQALFSNKTQEVRCA